MLRKLLLPMFATAMLAGCATDYRYRDGNGDYYYGQPRVEYRYQGPGGYFGGMGLGYGYGGFGATYYYDRFGRLVYGIPGGYYGSPYYRGNGWYRPRPHRGHGEHDNHDGDDGDDGAADNDRDRRPPWRDFGGLQQRDPDANTPGNRDDERKDRQLRMQRSRESFSEAPVRQQRPAPSAPVVRERRESSRMDGFSGGSVRRQGKRSSTPEE